MTKRPDPTDLAAALDGAAAILYALSSPLMEGDNRNTEPTIGAAIHGVAMLLDYVSADVGDLAKPGEGAAA